MNPSSRREYLLDRPGRYRILLWGTVDALWSDRLGGMAMSVTRLTDGTPLTLLSGELEDQSALIGVLNTLHDLSLPLMSVERIDAEAADPRRSSVIG